MSMKPTDQPINTHGMVLDFGKHEGQLLTRVPISYLKWLANINSPWAPAAKAEIDRRGHKVPTVDLSPHAIDNASHRVLDLWQNRDDKDEGFYSWLVRQTEEALRAGHLIGDKIHYNGMKFVVHHGEEYPVLKTIMKISRPEPMRGIHVD